jgi:hypothetical protein
LYVSGSKKIADKRKILDGIIVIHAVQCQPAVELTVNAPSTGPITSPTQFAATKNIIAMPYLWLSQVSDSAPPAIMTGAVPKKPQIMRAEKRVVRFEAAPTGAWKITNTENPIRIGLRRP